MPTQEQIDGQIKLLETHRQTLSHYLQQQSILSIYAPPSVPHGIREARENIRRTKAILRDWKVDIADDPDDDDISSSIKTPLEIVNRQFILPKKYVFISDRKIDLIFQQLPRSFVGSFDVEDINDNPYAKCAVVSAYLESIGEVGSIQEPRDYFKGKIQANLLTTDSEVFFGKKLRSESDTSTLDFYVGLSGQLSHMIGASFKKLRQKRGSIDSELIAELRDSKAQYFELNSSTKTFHNYLGNISHAESKGEERKFDPYANLPPRVQVLGISFAAWAAFFASPLLCVVFFWGKLSSWALCAIIPAVIWSILGAYIVLIVTGMYVTAMMNTATLFRAPPVEYAMIEVIDKLLYEVEEDYEFLAETIFSKEYEGRRVILGSPVFVALAKYTV